MGREGVILAACLAVPLLSPALAALGLPSNGASPPIHVRGDRLSVQLQGVPWPVVLAELERQGGFTVRVWGALDGVATAAFDALPLEKGLRRLFRDADLVLLYAGTGSQSRLLQLWIRSREERGPAQGSPTAVHNSLEVVLGLAATAETQEERQRAIAILAEGGDGHDPRVREVLLLALQDPAAAIRESAVDAFASLADETAVDELSRVLLEDPSEGVRESAAHALGQIASPRGVAALTRALADAVITVRQNAAEALGKIGGELAIDALQQALQDKAEEVQEVAQAAWRQLTGAGGQPELGTPRPDAR
jgi:hypothetical protein